MTLQLHNDNNLWALWSSGCVLQSESDRGWVWWEIGTIGYENLQEAMFWVLHHSSTIDDRWVLFYLSKSLQVPIFFTYPIWVLLLKLWYCCIYCFLGLLFLLSLYTVLDPLLTIHTYSFQEMVIWVFIYFFNTLFMAASLVLLLHFYISAWKSDVFPIWVCITIVKFPFFLRVHFLDTIWQIFFHLWALKTVED